MNFRTQCDNLVRSEDSDIFAYVSCIANLENSPLACMMDSEMPDLESVEPLPMDNVEKRQKDLAENVAVRASTSLESIQSYEEIKAEKLFVNPLTIRHVNNVPFTRLLRVGTNLCCFFNEALG